MAVPAKRGLAIADLLNYDEPLRKRKSPEITDRDERIQLQALYSLGGLTYQQIAERTGHTLRQVQTTCKGPAIPRKQKPRKGRIRTPEK